MYLVREEVCVVDLCGTIRKAGFLVHSFSDGDVNFLSIIKVCADFIAEFPLRDFDIVFGRTLTGHQTEKPLINVDLQILVFTHVKRSLCVCVGGTNWYSVRLTLGTSML
jgi:hypothetical protein